MLRKMAQLLMPPMSGASGAFAGTLVAAACVHGSENALWLGGVIGCFMGTTAWYEFRS